MYPIDRSSVIRSRGDAQISVDETIDTATTLLALPISIVIFAHVAKAARQKISDLVPFTLSRSALSMSEYESKDVDVTDLWAHSEICFPLSDPSVWIYLLFKGASSTFWGLVEMSTIVTAGVATCLASYNVDKSRYTVIPSNHEIHTNAIRPDDEDVELLRHCTSYWCASGVKVETPTQDALLDDLHQYDFVCLKPDDASEKVSGGAYGSRRYIKDSESDCLPCQ